LAVAGFSERDLSIILEDRQLVIQGKKNQETSTKIFLHRGIATRQFQRSFVLADGVEVAEAMMENGLLHIDLIQNIPENIVRKIKIKTNQ
jgi:HSP20 family molecular chaperone IbpA